MKNISYAVTGIDRAGKRFSMTFDNYIHAMGINLWQGTVWMVSNGKRKLIKRVYN